MNIPKLGENTATGTFTKYTDDEITILQREISENPNPTDERKAEIADELGRTFESIHKWFRTTTVSQNLKYIAHFQNSQPEARKIFFKTSMK